MLPCNLYYSRILHIDFFPWCIWKTSPFWGNRWQCTCYDSPELQHVIIIIYITPAIIKGACSDPLTHPSNFFFSKWYVQNLYSLGESSEKLSWKLENVVTTIIYKTQSNINTAFKQDTHLHFFSSWMIYWLECDHICQLKKNSFS